ncbi:hypothetical protein [Candidatus Dormiibacter inghamiae]|uniref:hypothetical protein n=1 Tax=Candidatus Dormiibacter inghamiae TaxID=3127013 RepID=UPI001A1DEEDF|nr:hypothetical protein [Candidatus Dormibacteraeota bacterium]
MLVYFFASAGSSDVLSAAAALRRQGARLALVGAKEKKLVLRPGTKHGVEYLKGELAA